MSWQPLLRTILENEHVELRPIEEGDREAYHAIAFDPEIWKYFVSRITNEAEFGDFMKSAMDDTAAGRRIAFCIIDKKTGRVAGSMSYGNLA